MAPIMHMSVLTFISLAKIAGLRFHRGGETRILHRLKTIENTPYCGRMQIHWFVNKEDALNPQNTPYFQFYHCKHP